jgi:methionyl-tRNA formyltransferase
MNHFPRVVFLGSKRIGLRILKEIYTISPDYLIGAITIDDREDALLTQHQAFQKYSEEISVPLFTVYNKAEADKTILKLHPDMGIVVGWYWLIGKNILDNTTNGFLGIHNSLLPKYRGGSPLVWSLINGDTKVGFSLFKLTSGMDDGPVWAQGSVNNGSSDYISDILNKIEEKTVKIFRETYLSIINKEIQPSEQDHSQATYCAQRLPNDGLINWAMPADYIYNFIRAQSEPYPGAFAWFKSSKLIIWRARTFPFKYFGTPGQVAKITKNGVYVICGNNSALILKDIQIGNKRGNAEELIQSFKVRF